MAPNPTPSLVAWGRSLAMSFQIPTPMPAQMPRKTSPKIIGILRFSIIVRVNWIVGSSGRDETSSETRVWFRPGKDMEKPVDVTAAEGWRKGEGARSAGSSASSGVSGMRGMVNGVFSFTTLAFFSDSLALIGCDVPSEGPGGGASGVCQLDGQSCVIRRGKDDGPGGRTGEALAVSWYRRAKALNMERLSSGSGGALCCSKARWMSGPHNFTRSARSSTRNASPASRNSSPMSQSCKPAWRNCANGLSGSSPPLASEKSWETACSASGVDPCVNNSRAAVERTKSGDGSSIVAKRPVSAPSICLSCWGRKMKYALPRDLARTVPATSYVGSMSTQDPESPSARSSGA